MGGALLTWKKRQRRSPPLGWTNVYGELVGSVRPGESEGGVAPFAWEIWHSLPPTNRGGS